MQYQTTLFRRLRGRSLAVLAITAMLLVQALIGQPVQAAPGSHPQYTINGMADQGTSSTCTWDGSGSVDGGYSYGDPVPYWNIWAELMHIDNPTQTSFLYLCGTQEYEASPLGSEVETCRARGTGRIVAWDDTTNSYDYLHVDHVEIETLNWLTGQAVWQGTWHDYDDVGATGTLHGTTLFPHGEGGWPWGLCGYATRGQRGSITGTLTLLDD